VLELGGNDPLIILNDLSDDDLAKGRADLAVAGATEKFRPALHGGSSEILVQESVADRFVPMVLEASQKKSVFGDPMDRSTDSRHGVVHEKAACVVFEARVHMAAEARCRHPLQSGSPRCAAAAGFVVGPRAAYLRNW